jgi:hypothetical protein
MKIRGTIRGQSIELQDPPMGLEGVEVVIEIPDFAVSSEQVGSNQFSVSDEERLVRLNRLFGVWKDQADLDPIFAEIDRERHAYRGRSIDSFD